MKVKYKETEKFTREVINEILEVKEEKGLTPESLLEKARNKKSSLNSMFDWDDSTAAKKWRLQEARLIINQVKIIVEDKEMYAFENVSVSVNENVSENKVESRREYKPIVEIMNNEDYRKQLIDRALQEAVFWKDRHSELNELQPIFTSIENTKTKWQKKKK